MNRSLDNNLTQRQRIGCLAFSTASPDEAVEKILELAERPEFGTPVFFANAYTIALAESDPSYRTLLCRNVFTYADGRPISWLSALARQSPAVRQVRGPAMFEAVFAAGQARGIRHFLLGSTPDVLDKLESNLLKRYPKAKIVGKLAPPFSSPSPVELATRDLEIRNSGAQVVWVGLGTPKQDFEAARIASSTSVIALAVGAAFDFSAGVKPEAPVWMSRMGFEWIFRLASEPRRLWRRYFFGNLAFLKSCWSNRSSLREPVDDIV